MPKPIWQCGCEPGHICNEQYDYVHNKDDGYYREQNLRNRPLKAVRRHVQVETYWRRYISDFQVGEKDTTKVDGVNAEALSQRNQQRHLDHTRRIHAHQTANNQSK